MQTVKLFIDVGEHDSVSVFLQLFLQLSMIGIQYRVAVVFFFISTKCLSCWMKIWAGFGTFYKPHFQKRWYAEVGFVQANVWRLVLLLT